MTAPTTRQRIGPHAITALAVGLTVGYLAGDILPEVVDALRNDLGMSATMAGTVTTALLLATALAGLVFARRAGRPGRARFAAGGTLVGMGGFVAAAFAPTTGVLIAACVVAGLGSGVVLAYATAAIAATPDRRRRNPAVSPPAGHGCGGDFHLPVHGPGRSARSAVVPVAA